MVTLLSVNRLTLQLTFQATWTLPRWRRRLQRRWPQAPNQSKISKNADQSLFQSGLTWNKRERFA